MDADLHLNAEETAFVSRHIRGHYEHAKPDASLSDYLAHWVRLVKEVEEGYRATLYDYQAELYVRNALERMKEEGPASLREKLSGWLQPWDRRFAEATRPSDRPAMAHRERSDGEWWFRIPVKAGPELAKDLRDEGFL